MKVATRPPQAATSPSQGLPDALADLESLVLSAQDDPEFIHELISDWQAILEKLPDDVRRLSPELKELRQDPLSQLAARIQQALPLLVDRIERVQSASPR